MVKNSTNKLSTLNSKLHSTLNTKLTKKGDGFKAVNPPFVVDFFLNMKNIIMFDSERLS